MSNELQHLGHLVTLLIGSNPKRRAWLKNRAEAGLEKLVYEPALWKIVPSERDIGIQAFASAIAHDWATDYRDPILPVPSEHPDKCDQFGVLPRSYKYWMLRNVVVNQLLEEERIRQVNPYNLGCDIPTWLQRMDRVLETQATELLAQETMVMPMDEDLPGQVPSGISKKEFVEIFLDRAVGAAADAWLVGKAEKSTEAYRERAGDFADEFLHEAYRTATEPGYRPPGDFLATEEKLGNLVALLSPPKGAFTDLADWAQKNLRKKQQRVVLLLCQREGRIPIAELAMDDEIEWSVGDKGWDNISRELNKKFRKHSLQYRLRRHDSDAVIDPTPLYSNISKNLKV